MRVRKKQVKNLKIQALHNNIVISGLQGDNPGEDISASVESFFRAKMKMELCDDEVVSACRPGAKIGKKPCVVIVKCRSSLRQSLYTQHLKGLWNPYNDFYYVNQHYPEEVAAERRELQYKLKKIRDKNKQLPVDKQVSASIKNGVLIVNNEPQRKMVSPPSVADIISIDHKEHSKMCQMKIAASDVIRDKGSLFTGYAAKASSLTEVRRAHKKVRLLHPEADHVISAYTTSRYEGGNDDGEFGASFKLQKFLDNRGSVNTAVFVARNFGGTLLGPKRFIHIESFVKDALISLQSELQHTSESPTTPASDHFQAGGGRRHRKKRNSQPSDGNTTNENPLETLPHGS